MASNTRASPVSPLGSRRSIVRSTESAACVSAASNRLYDDNGMGLIFFFLASAEIGGLAADRAIGRKHDLFDLHLGLGQFLLAVLLEQRAPFVRRDRFVELHLTAFELLDDAFQFLQGVLKRKRCDILRHGGFFGQFRLSGGWRDGSRPHRAGPSLSLRAQNADSAR